MEKKFQLGFRSQHSNPGIPSQHWDQPGHWGWPDRSASWMDWSVTKHYRENGFLTVLLLHPTAKSLRFLTIYHCKCLTYLLASVQFVCIITLFLEGRDLGLLLYKDRFVIYGLYVFVKGNKMGRIFGTCFLWIWQGGRFARLPKGDSCSTPSDNSKKGFQPRLVAVSAVKMLCPLCTLPETGSILRDHFTTSIKQMEPCPSKKPWIPPHFSNRTLVNIPRY